MADFSHVYSRKQGGAWITDIVRKRQTRIISSLPIEDLFNKGKRAVDLQTNKNTNADAMTLSSSLINGLSHVSTIND